MEEGLREYRMMLTEEEHKALMRLLGDMRARATVPTPPAHRNEHFLRTQPQQVMYGRCVRAYYLNYMAERNLSHKEQMLHWAAIYEVIAELTGLRRPGEEVPFYGPEFDRFLLDCCHIQYNSSQRPRGRYRSVEDVLRKYAARTSAEGLSAQESRSFALYQSCVRQFRKLASQDRKPVSYSRAVVPPKL